MDWVSLTQSWVWALQAANKSPRTVQTYEYALRRFLAYETPETAAEARVALRGFFARELAHHKPASVSVWFRALQQFFKWAEAEEEIVPNPLAGMPAPQVPVEPPPVLTLEQVARVLAVTEGTDFRARRDHAIIRLFFDTGCRLDELASLMLDRVDMREREATVVGKGRRVRVVTFGTNTAGALDRYLRKRRRQRHAALPNVWISHMGAMTRSGIFQVVRDRGRQAGVEGLHPHQFRHTLAHRWLEKGGAEVALQSFAGWQSPQMLRRYGASVADVRARDAHRKLGLGDDV